MNWLVRLESHLQIRFNEIEYLYVAAAFIEEHTYFPINDAEKLAGIFCFYTTSSELDITGFQSRIKN